MELGALLITVLLLGIIKLVVLFMAVRITYRLFGSIYATPPRKLWYLLPEENRSEIKLLWWSLAAFFFSEFFCGIETYILFRSSPILGGLHSLSAAIGMALFGTGIYIFLQKRVIYYGKPRCLVRRICQSCPKMKGDDCKMRLPSQLIIVLGIVATLPLFFASTEIMVADISRFILPFPALNQWFDQWRIQSSGNFAPLSTLFFLPSSTQIIDYRIIPAAVLILFVGAAALLRYRREHAAFILMSGGAGALSYSYLQLVTHRATGDLLIGSIAHELTEYWFLLFVAEVLRQAFGYSLQTRATQPLIQFKTVEP